MSPVISRANGNSTGEMRLVFKISKIVASIIFIITIVLFTSSLFVQDKVAAIILRSLNKNLLTKYDFESVRLSFLKRFPKASLDIRDVFVHSSPGFDPSCFNGMNTDTLLSARLVTMDFRITDIIRGIYNIDRIGIKDGFLKLYTDTSGFVNYELVAKRPKAAEDIFVMDIKKIDLSDVYALYNNRATKLLINGYARSGSLKSRISGKDIDFSAISRLRIDKFQLYDFSMTRIVEVDFDVNLHSSDKEIMFTKSDILIEKNSFQVNGSVSSGNILDLSFTGNNINLSGIKKYVPLRYLEKLSAYDPAGIMNVQCNFKGLLSRTSNPLMEIAFDVKQGRVKYKNSPLSINNLSFRGFYTNGSSMKPETSRLSVSDFEGRFGSSQYRGSFSLSDFKTMNSTLKLSGKLVPSEIKAFFNLKEISTATGLIDFNLNMAGNLQKKSKFILSDFFNFHPEASLNFKSFSLGLRNDSILFKDASGDIKIADTVFANNFKFTFRDQEFKVSGVMTGFPDKFSGLPAARTIKAEVKCNKLDPSTFNKRKQATGMSLDTKNTFVLPADLFFDIDFIIDRFNYKTFSADNVTGSVNYKPRVFDVKSLNLNSLDGNISGNCLIAQNNDKSFVGQGAFKLDKIDIRKTFTSFNNFGQKFIKAENLDGSLSGSLSLLLPFDSLMHPVIKGITAEGKYVISRGALIEFDPVKELSSFIKLSELKTIHFEELENDFFIRNNYLYIPQMEVKSTAANLSVSGKHDFNNNYEYHVKIQLSELLSKKLRKPRPNTTEFGAVQDDGLGRTSLLLKIINKGKEAKVSYDVKAVGNQIKNDIKTERQTLRKILNEEYGLYPADSVEKKKPDKENPRFRVIWEE